LATQAQGKFCLLIVTPHNFAHYQLILFIFLFDFIYHPKQKGMGLYILEAAIWDSMHEAIPKTFPLLFSGRLFFEYITKPKQKFLVENSQRLMIKIVLKFVVFESKGNNVLAVFNNIQIHKTQ